MELGNRLINLKVLALGGNELTGDYPDAGWAASPTSKNCTYGSNELTGEIPSELGSLANLSVELHLADGNQLTGEVYRWN